jgi:hypothetical protein
MTSIFQDNNAIRRAALNQQTVLWDSPPSTLPCKCHPDDMAVQPLPRV